MKVLLLLILIINSNFANSKIYNAYALAIYDENGVKEIIKDKRKTNKDYKNICITEVLVNSKYKTDTPHVTIGTSIGHLISSKSIYNKNNIKIGEILKFKHYNVIKGYLKITINNKIYDQKTFIK
ncbi:hypothetical protein CRV01_12020 [Arcobacter sp. CECT 8983]|uniref:hypothetical protein n=1 Tax=Arcobacter sp. CECT 8983 TaxID=2044508 RepID=UPI00100B591B|nr:hypothetical protein [Arcobacter sp. CECT 8983]RXJ88469.1 hypothetical protein CRV01_12020 [Arcobacter sp. CECT 8983]